MLLRPSPKGRFVAVSAVLAAAACVVTAPIAAHAFRMPLGHDLTWHVALVRDISAAMSQGDLYPRWSDQVNVGFGLPALVCYPPLTALFTGALSMLFGSVSTGMAVAVWLMSFGAGAAWYWCARDYVSVQAAVVGAMLYMLSPYAIINLYSRFALAEYGSFVWAPLVLKWGLSIARGESRPAVLWLGASFAGLLMTHVIGAYLVVLAAIPFLLASIRHPRRVGRLIAALLIGLALALPYLGPLVGERHLVRTDLLFMGRSLRFDLGLERQWAYDAGCILAYVMALQVVRHPRFTMAWKLLLSMGAAASLTFDWSRPLWEHVPGLRFVVFPFRLVFVLTLLGPFALSFTWRSRPRAYVALGLALYGAFSAISVSHEVVHRARRYEDPATMDIDHVRRYRLWVREHIPRTVGSPWSPPQHENHAWLSEGAEGQVLSVSRSPSTRQVHVRVPEAGAALAVRTFYYPGWVAEADGVPLETRPDADGALEAVLPRGGEYDVTFRYRGTELQRRSEMAGLVAWLLFLGFVAVRRYRRPAVVA